MGTLRLLLALAVVVAHIDGQRIFGLPFMSTAPYQAVSCFFIISGFYMALVIRTKYGVDKKAFWRARFVRLAPVYALSLVLFFSVQSAAALAGKPMGVWVAMETKSFSGLDYAWATVANITTLSSDIILLKGALSGCSLKDLLVLPVVWSLSIEICFYLLAPFILLRSRYFLWSLFVGAWLLRLFVSWWHGYQWTFWNFFFFPTNLCFFLAGSLAWCAVESAPQTCSKWLGWLGWGVLIIFIAWGGVFFTLRSVGGLYLAFALLIGPVFLLTKKWSWDRAIGELSYPVYLVHWGLLSVWSPVRHIIPESAKVYAIAAGSIVLSLLLLRLEEYLKRWGVFFRRTAS